MHNAVVSTPAYAQYSSVSLATYAGKQAGRTHHRRPAKRELLSCIEEIVLRATATSSFHVRSPTMQALAAIRLASNVAQFVERAVQFTKLAHKFASSDSGPIGEHEGIIAITNSMAETMKEINQDNTDAALKSLASQCLTVTVNVQNIINELSKKPEDNFIRSLHKAGRTPYKQKEIQELSDLLSNMRAQVSKHLLTLIRSVPASWRQMGWR